MELFDYWREYPPQHWLLRGFVGYEPPKKIEGEAADSLRVLSSTRRRNKKVSSAPKDVRKMIETLKATKIG